MKEDLVVVQLVILIILVEMNKNIILLVVVVDILVEMEVINMVCLEKEVVHM